MTAYICECGNEFTSDMAVCPLCGSGIVFVKENVESLARCGITEECNAVDYTFRKMSEKYPANATKVGYALKSIMQKMNT